MDFQNLKRKELQALCKKHNIPANLSNLSMANRLTAIFKPQEIEKPSAQDLDEIETETDSNNVLSDRKFKKVRFSPDNEVFEFTKSAGNKSRKNSRLVVGGGRLTRSRGQDLVEVSVKEKKRGKNAVICNSDTHSLVTIENCDNRAVTRRSTRNSGVVDKGNLTVGLGMNTREEVWKENKISEDAVIVNKPQILLGSSRLKPYDNYVKRDKVMDQDAIADAKAFVEPHIRVRRSTRKSNNNCEGRDEVTVDKKIIEGKVIVEPQRRSKRKDNYHCEESDEVLKKKELAEEKVTVEPQILPRRSKRKGINNHEGSHEADFCEEVGKDKKTAVAKVIAEPRIILRRPKRKVNMIDDSEMLIDDAKKQEHVESRGLRKTRKLMSFKGSGVDTKDTENTAKNEGKIEVITHIQESMKVKLRRNRRTSVMPGNESLGNDDTNKLSSSVMQEDSTKGVSKGEKVCQPGGVLRRSGRNTLKLEIVSATENLDTDEAIQKIVKKDTSAVQSSIGTSHRKPSKYTSPKISAEFAGDAINQLENEEMNIENNACFRKDVLNDDSDPLFMTKSSRMESKVQGKKLSCNLSGSSLLEASSQESLMANEESLSAQLSVTALSMSSTKTNKDKRLTSSTESARNIQDSSIADGIRNADTESINGIPLANFDETETFRTSELLINSTNCDAISDRVVDIVQLSLDADVQKLVEQTNCGTQKNEVAAPVLCQIEDPSCHNITNNNELPLAFNVSEKVGIAGTSSIADILTHCDQTDFEADMKVTEGEVEKCAQLCLDFVNLVSQVKGVSFQENVVLTDQQCINELALPIQCHLGDVDIPEASKESSEKNDENCAPEAGEVSASKPSGSVVSALKEAGVAETTEKTEAEDVQSKILCDNMSLDKNFIDDVDIFRKSEEGLYKITDEPDEQPKTPFDIAKNFPLMESYSHGSKTTRNSLSISKTSYRQGETTHQTVKKFIPDGNEPIKIEISSKVDEFSVLERDLDSREGVSNMKEVEIQNQSLEKVREAGNELVNASPGNSILPKCEGAIGEDLNLAINVEMKKVNASLNLPVAMDAPIEVYEEKCAGMLCSRLIETSLMNSQGQSILDEEADDSDTEVRCHDKSLDTDWSKNLADENSGHVKIEGKTAQTNEVAFCVSATGTGMCPIPTNFEDSNSERETFNEAFGGHLNDEVAKAGSIDSEIDVVMMDKDESTEKKYVQTADSICNVESEKPIEPKLLDIEEIKNPCQKHIMCDEGEQLLDEESGQSFQVNMFGNLFLIPEQNINSSGLSEASSRVAKIPNLVTSFDEQDCSLTEKKKEEANGVSGSERKFESTYCGKVEGKIAQTNEEACCLSATGIGMCPVPTSFEDSNTVRETFNEAFGEVAKAGSIGSEIDVEMVDRDESTENKYVQTAEAARSMNESICSVESEKPIEPKLLDIDDIENPCQKHIMSDEGKQLLDEESGQSLQENVFGNLFGTPEQNINSSGPSEASSSVAKIPSLVTSFNERDCSLTEKKDEPDGVSDYERKFESTYCIESVPSMMKDALIQSICHEEVGEAGNELVNKHTVSLPISVLTDRKGPSEEEINLIKNVEVVNFNTCSFAPMDKYVPTEDQSTCAEMTCDRMKGTSSLSEQTMYSQGQSIIDEEAKGNDIEVRCHDKSLDTDLSENLKEGDIAQTNEVPICISATGIGMCPFPTKCEDNNSLRETFNDVFRGPPFQEVAKVGSIGRKIDVVMMEKDETTEKKLAQTADAAGSMYDAICKVGSERPVEPKLVGMEEIANPCQELLECNITCDEGEQLSDEESGQSLQENEFGNLFGTPEQNINSSGPSEAYSCVAKIPSLATSFDEQDCSLTEKKHEIDGVSGSEFKMESTNYTERVPRIKIDTLIQPICHEDVGEADNELVNSYTVSPAISVLADRKSPSVEDVKDVEVVNLNTSPIFQMAKHFPTEASQEKCSEMTCDRMKRTSCISEKNDLHLWNTIFAEDATVSDSEIIDKVGGADLLKLATTEKNNCFAANCEDNITVRESFFDAFEEPLNSEVGRTGSIEGEILIMDKGTLCSPFTEEITCEMKSNDGNSYDANCLDHIDDIPRFSHEMNDELHINIQADVMSYSEADILASNSEKQSTVKESKETHVTFQNAAEDRSTFLHVEPDLFTGLEMQLLKGEHDITDTGNSEAEPYTFCLEGDHVKHCRDGESNSAKSLVLHLQEKVEDFSNDSLPVSDLPSSQCDEILKESDVLDTIKEYINSEFSLSADFHDSGCANLPFDISTHMEEGNNNDNAASSKTRETESCAASISIVSGKEIDTEDSRLFSTAKKNARTILIHGTPGKSLKMADMKENAPKSKISQRGDFTTVRPAKRKALQDIRWK